MARKGTSLNINNMGSWPAAYQAVAAAVIAAVILLLAWLLVFRGQREELTGLEGTETSLRQDLETKAGKAANLEPLKQQLATMEKDLQEMLRQLPSKTEMPDVITDISQSALASGLRVELFKPQAEVKKDIYAEKPIDLRFAGGFHQFGAFMSSVASLPRVVIMTMNNIALTPRDKNSGLQMAGTVKTYRYLDESERAPPPVKGKDGKPVPAPAKPDGGAK
ncbi:type 4a pilus biogenesis protein PilO [Solilutibacter silvestris]|uniref:Tfp pilus assembly protein PilO n=1 Tax=Solilutibacter silvestris TaxID=1645665 RepID=A0A2K1PX51_9GAMM|nr:type 4a pilus biogenesis protein PilO [Lysobacter silvestris]PNS07349.1 Tfp pilus assembly protein PilO [Lysobacter silvestris]